MLKNIAYVLSVAVFALIAYMPALSAEAALITDEQVEAQKEVLQESVNDLLKEELKLIQMVFIQLLELRVDQLEAQINES